MSRLDGSRVLVAGAGALGSAVGWRLQRGGAQVTLADPAPRGDNASGVAAGMLAPAFEAALDPASAAHFTLLEHARDRWPAFVEALGAEEGALDRSGALWAGDEASIDQMQARLLGQGAGCERLTRRQAQALSPGLHAPDGAVFTGEDWRLDPQAMLGALHRALSAEGGELAGAALTQIEEGRARLSDGRAIAVDQIVLAAGLSPAGLADPPPELARLQPIKGQIARLAGVGPRGGPVARAPGVYVVPAMGGAIVGATMESDRTDRHVEAAALEQLRALASPLYADLEGAKIAGAAGVRASTPDALPMAGPSSRPGVVLALGARRNGWLLAPLIAEIICARLAGEAPGAWDTALDPLRVFSPPG